MTVREYEEIARNPPRVQQAPRPAHARAVGETASQAGSAAVQRAVKQGYHYLCSKRILKRFQFMCNEKQNKSEKEICITTDIAVIRGGLQNLWELKPQTRDLSNLVATAFFALLKKQMLEFKRELQRRLDQTLGKPGSYLAGIDRAGNVKPMTIGARLYRVEQQLSVIDKKLDQLVYVLNAMAQKQQIPLKKFSSISMILEYVVKDIHFFPEEDNYRKMKKDDISINNKLFDTKGPSNRNVRCFAFLHIQLIFID
ncbi:Potassium voltage-gated channel subfamily KQT member 1 [Melipona quadrifasciata]|uniref:Potassium voltage-gated channel subfamily KQT member 1 n=1 Tax=Melipona quadrifasciata TaxID=166423 RepID=A0A0N0BER7_9HYME|nr:Potassium voltage-gated channel subfamily KQT member 1 [Melipona quadrifasciata]